ncbi:MAG TPA: amino acid permease [Marinobacter sp.]|uniref:Amino acid permease/ SLC12A domain-containing protein n=1 Tax=marine sediment metagenome TaxID=412755 RepID=A0A0F9PMA3_9ZZZZ|nr:amino acid permease [Marinobacter sp.]HEB35090.1 amino acid permease [Candidatus Aminicenantes bacterium]
MSTSDTQHHPRRVLGSGFTLAVVIGGTIGLGILRTPGEIATVVTDPLMFVSLWVLGGLFSLLCAFVLAELIGMTPRSGGTYALVRRAYGPFSGFVIGWVDWLCFVGDIALKAVVVTEFAAMLIPAAGQWKTPLAIIVSSVFAALQLRGIALGAKIQQIAAAALALIVVGFTLALVFAESAVSSGTALVPHAVNGLGAWSLVFASIFYTYDGWDYPAYFGGEIKGGGGAVARSMIKGVVILTLLYVFLVAALVWKVPLASLAGKELALASALEMVISPLASTVVLVAAIIILLAHQNLIYMSTPRILQAMAVDGLAVRRAGEISKGGNPMFAVLLSWGFSVGLIMIGGFHFLLYLLMFFVLFITVVLIAGVIILRSRQPDADRPYRAWGHPWSTYTCLVGCILLTLFQAVAQIHTAAYAAIFVAISWPVYRYLVRSRSN